MELIGPAPAASGLAHRARAETAAGLSDLFVREPLDELLLEGLLLLEACDVEPDPVELMPDEDATAEAALVLAPALVTVPGCAAAAVAPKDSDRRRRGAERNDGQLHEPPRSPIPRDE